MERNLYEIVLDLPSTTATSTIPYVYTYPTRYAGLKPVVMIRRSTHDPK